MLRDSWKRWRSRRARAHRVRAIASGEKRAAFRLHRLELLEDRTLLTGGTWTALSNPAPGGVGAMDLLPNGTVMAQGAYTSNTWYALTPNSSGSYASGTWSTLASMETPRLYYATAMLPDGDFFVAGGEYTDTVHNWSNASEVYNPATNSWSSAPYFPETETGADPAEVLPNGDVMVGYIAGPQTFLYNPATNTWSNGPTKLFDDPSGQENWVKLPDGSILSYDVSGDEPNEAQRYVPSLNAWVDAGTVPVTLWLGEEQSGSGELLPDGDVIYIGATGDTAIYTPPTTLTGTGTWTQGPTIPSGLGDIDGPSAVTVDGNVLFAANTPPVGNSSVDGTGPSTIFEYSPTLNSITSIPDTSGPNLTNAAYAMKFLALPSGQVLLNTGAASQLYLFTPSGSPSASWAPTITNVSVGSSGYTLTGMQLNGLSEGANDGCQIEAFTNYPIIQLSPVGQPNVVYNATTSEWSSVGVQTGSTPETVQFTIPASVPAGSYNLYVVANGISSSAWSFTVSPNEQVFGNGQPVANGEASPATSNSTNFGLVPSGGAASTLR